MEDGKGGVGGVVEFGIFVVVLVFDFDSVACWLTYTHLNTPRAIISHGIVINNPRCAFRHFELEK